MQTYERDPDAVDPEMLQWSLGTLSDIDKVMQGQPLGSGKGSGGGSSGGGGKGGGIKSKLGGIGSLLANMITGGLSGTMQANARRRSGMAEAERRSGASMPQGKPLVLTPEERQNVKDKQAEAVAAEQRNIVREKDQAAYKERVKRADEQKLTGRDRTEYVLTGKMPSGAGARAQVLHHVAKPGEEGKSYTELIQPTGEAEYIEEAATPKAPGSELSGSLKELAEAKKIVNDPKAPPENKEAAKMFLAKYAASGQPIDPATAAFMGQLLMAGGPQAVPLGFGAQVRIPVFKEVAKLAKKLNLTPNEIVSNWKSVEANTRSLDNLTKFADFTDAFSSFTYGQMDRLDKAADAVGLPSDTRLFNAPVSAWREKVQGDPKMMQYLQQLNTTKNELNRLLTAPGSQGQVPVQMQQELDKFLNDQLSPSAIRAVTGQARKELLGRKQTYSQKVKEIKGRISSGQQEPEEPADNGGDSGGSVVDDLVKQYGGAQ